MNELETYKQNLPDTIEDLAKFTFMGREKLIALNAAIRACSKQEMLSEKMNEMKTEAKGLAEAVLIAETELGKMLSVLPQARANQHSVQTDSVVHQQTKQQAITDAGISPKQAQRFQHLAKHEDKVQEAIASARERDVIVTRQDVINKIAQENSQKRETFQEANRRELKEATQRHDEFSNKKKGSVTSFADALQDKKDTERIGEAFYDEVERIGIDWFVIGSEVKRDVIKPKIYALSDRDAKTLLSDLREWRNTMDFLIREIERRVNGRKS